MNALPGGLDYQRLSPTGKADARRMAKSAGSAGDALVRQGAIGWLRWVSAITLLVAAVLFAVGGYLLASRGQAGIPVLILGLLDAVVGVRYLTRSASLSRNPSS